MSEIEANNVNIYTTNSEPEKPIKRKPDKNKQNRSVAQSKRLSKVASGGFTAIKRNINKNLLKTLGFGIIGGIGYALVPTGLQAVTKNDWSGFKGLATGVSTMSLIGLATGHTEMLVGSVCAAGAHLTYAKGTGFIERTLNVPIYRMNPHNANSLQNKQLNDRLDTENYYPNAQSIDELINQLNNNY